MRARTGEQNALWKKQHAQQVLASLMVVLPIMPRPPVTSNALHRFSTSSTQLLSAQTPSLSHATVELICELPPSMNGSPFALASSAFARISGGTCAPGVSSDSRFGPARGAAAGFAVGFIEGRFIVNASSRSSLYDGSTRSPPHGARLAASARIAAAQAGIIM